MTKMRHPAPDVLGEIDIPEDAVAMHRMTGWVTEEENPDLFKVDDEPADDSGGGSEDEETAGETGEQKTKRRRPRPSATSEGND